MSEKIQKVIDKNKNQQANGKLQLNKNLKNEYLSFINEGKKIETEKKVYKPNLNSSRIRQNRHANDIADIDMESNEKNWESPKNPLKRSLSNPELDPIKLKNRYTELSNDAGDASSNNDASSHTTQQRNIKVKPPPIYTSDLDTRSLIMALNENDKNSFTIKNTGDNNHTVRTTTMENFEKIKKTLKEKQVQFFTYAPQNLKTKSVVLKHISGNLSVEEVKSEIESHNPENITITKVIKFSSKLKPNEHYYVIILTPESKISNVTKINNIAQQVPKWEPYKKKLIYQCHKCQEIGHSSNNCFKKYRCVKCLDDHKQGECKVPKGQKTDNVACVNCGEKGHPASYLGCPFLKFAAKTIKTNKKITYTNKLEKENKLINMVTQGRSYANVLAPTRENINKNYNPTRAHNDNSFTYQEEIDAKLEELKQEILTILTAQLDNIISKIKENRSLLNVNIHNRD